MKIKSLLSLSLAAALSVASLSGCAELMKGMGEAAAGLMTEKTANISNASVQASYITNLFPRETQETGLQYIGEAWQPGKNALSVIFFKHKGLGMYEIDGKLSYRNAGSKDAPKPLPMIAFGAYSAVLEANDLTPKEITVETSSGQRFAFTVSPAPTIQIAKVNGQASGSQLDLSKDVVLELANAGADPNSRLKVSLLTTVQGIKSFVDVGVFKPAAKIVIPAAAFKHPAISASSAGFVGFDPGPNFLRVERYQVRGSESLKERPVAAFQNLGQSWSTVPVTVTTGARDLSKVEIRGEMPLAPQKKLFYDVYVPNAFYGRPFSAGKQFAVAALQLDGQLLKKETFQSEHYGFGYKVITTTTITKQFPQLPDSHWDQLLQTLHTDLSAYLKKQYNITMVPTEKVVKAATYAELEVPAEENTEVFIKRSYKGSKFLLPRSFTGILDSVSSTFASDRPMARLMKETGTDGLIAMGLSLQVASDENDHIVLVPVLNYQVYGPPNGYTVPTMYASGRVIGTGTPFNAQELSNPANLPRVVQLKELMSGFQKALADLEAKERAAGYQAIWALQ